MTLSQYYRFLSGHVLRKTIWTALKATQMKHTTPISAKSREINELSWNENMDRYQRKRCLTFRKCWLCASGDQTKILDDLLYDEWYKINITHLGQDLSLFSNKHVPIVLIAAQSHLKSSVSFKVPI